MALAEVVEEAGLGRLPAQQFAGQCAGGRRVPEPAASLAAEAGIAVFRIAFERWTAEDCLPDLAVLIRESFDELKAVAAGR